MKPILFNTEMVRAILDGRKTVARRVIKPQPIKVIQGADNPIHAVLVNAPNETPKGIRYRPDDILYVRETWAEENGRFYYRADYAPHTCAVWTPFDGHGWKPSIHMPREAARIFLRVTEVRVERLQDISSEQIDAEGCKEWGYSAETGELLPSGPSWFKIMWNNTIKPDDRARYVWDANPWVWAIRFHQISKDETEAYGAHCNT